MYNINNSVKNTWFTKHNEFNSRTKTSGDPFASFEPYEFQCSGIILEISNKPFSCAMSFCRITFNSTSYLNKWKVRIKFRNLIKPGSVNIFVWKIIQQILSLIHISEPTRLG